MEVDNEYIYVDLLDTAGEVCLKVYTKTIQENFLLERSTVCYNSGRIYKGVK